ncbi:SpvB/TcaC N-terminal domain-containing protein [Mucilaginibacter sp. NFX135]|uniref:SpvB/TcaC N-terminal domain-containing protein n=1 Tax=Mucilaginibacter sp. NFX135 TaxID=3402687 RepID=UPI003AFB4AF7
MKKYSIFILLAFVALVSVNTALAQDETYVPPAPASVSMIKAAATDVNLYAGKAEINIPIYTVKEGSLSTGISLKYTGGSGIKVQEIPGEAGLGWALLAGGVITRTTRGTPDEESSGYFSNPVAGYLQNSPDSPDFQKAFSVGGANDLEPDVYNSTTGGRIIFGKDKVPHFMNEQGFKVIKDGIFSTDHSWIIADSRGTQYYFGETVNAQERFAQTTSTGAQSLSSKISAWHLTRIVSKDGASIFFEYEKSGQLSSFNYYSFTRSNKNDEAWQNSIATLSSPCEEIHLSKIKTSNATIEFSYIDRLDFANSKAISEIKVLDKQNQLLTKYGFDTDYFKSDDLSPTLRLKMKAVKQYNTSLNKTYPIATFNYNEQENLPARKSEKFDYWGYYNDNRTGKYFVSEGAYRDADANKCQANILTGIQWPTGGSTNYFYELNSYYLPYNFLYYGGGLRVREVTEVNTGAPAMSTKYDYSKHDIFNPTITTGIVHTLFDIRKGYMTTDQVEFKDKFLGNNIYRSENALPLTKAIDLDGISVGYSEVTVIHPDQSTETYGFRDYANFPDDTKLYSYTAFTLASPPRVENFSSISNRDQYDGFDAVTSNAAQRGLITYKKIQDANNKLIKSISYKYDVFTGTQIPGAEISLIYSYTPDLGQNYANNYKTFWISSVYYERVMAARLTEIKEDNYTYSPASVQAIHSVNTLNGYKNAPYPLLLATQTLSQSDGTTLTISYNYPSDMVSSNKDASGIYQAMIDKNIIAPVIETASAKNGKMVLFSRTNYDKFNSNQFFPKSIEQQIGDNPIKVKQLFNSYNTYGNLTEEQQFNGVKVSYLWGYNGQYPVAQIINSDYATVSSIITQSQIDAAATAGDSALRTLLNTLRTDSRLKNAQSIAYTYTPMIGMTSITDPKGAITYYEYDGFQRLMNIKDKDGNIVKQTNYHYKQ